MTPFPHRRPTGNGRRVAVGTVPGRSTLGPVSFLRRIFQLGEAVADVETAAPTFALGEPVNIPAELFGVESYATNVSPAPRIDRRSAIQVPAVKRSRDLIAGTLGGLPLTLSDPTGERVNASLFDQPERNVPRSVTMSRLFEDLLFEGEAWWRITERGWTGFPTFVKRIPPRVVTVDDGTGRVYVNGKHVPDEELIRFDSPTDGLLKAGARAIRTCLQLDVAAANAANGVPAIEYFRPVDGEADPGTETEIREMLDAYELARRQRIRGYVPAALKLEEGGWDPKKLQLAEQRQHAVLEIARVAGIDPEELGVSTTSRTYANQFDRRKAFTDFTLGLYQHAAEDRLSMGDINPRGYVAAFDLDAFFRSDPLARFNAYKAGLEVGAIDQAEIRPAEGKPPLELGSSTPTDPGAPASVTQIRSA